MADHGALIVGAEARLIRIPVDPPRGDAIQQFAALELPIVELTDAAGRRDGFQALKLKVGKPDTDEDCERVAKVREAVGPHTTLMVDANQSWSIDTAITRIRRLEAYDLYWIEEPLEATDLDGFARLGQHTSLARAGGESL